MVQNEGMIDRGLRVVVGAALIIAAATHELGWWAYIGVVPLLTGLAGNCPAYGLLGINTCPSRKA
ncbi:MAG: hypothetical protein B7Z78_04015 [Rhodospirillales bacterium 20-60-12]|nr:MAG: hypothetical protein B7Z78_04015 [Rhodospirillales bacterium 20-60-12]HQT67897.1 DUF2892 domain-containing protein [Acetobacteraceae bacterium]HQU02469.1 DUF2892 domain-containing protein [Acetobacteraceae bacterium]